MKSAAFSLLVAAGLIPLSPISRADELDELLKPKTDIRKLTDENAKDSWNKVVDAFRRNDLTQASELGQAFLDSNFAATPYQLLGVKVMMNLAGENAQITTANLETKRQLDTAMKERVEITNKYKTISKQKLDADAVINRLTLNRKQAVQEGTAAHRECIRNSRIMDWADIEMEKMRPLIEKNKATVLEIEARLTAETKGDVLRLLDMLVTADELEAAFAITNVYLRKAGEDLDIAKKQQDVVRLQEVHEKALKIAAAIRKQQQPLVEERRYWAARKVMDDSLSKVRQQAGDEDLVRKVVQIANRDELGISAEIAKAQLQTDSILELAGRDPGEAERQLSLVRQRYPDHPHAENVAILRMAANTSAGNRGKISELLASIESLADTDPAAALSLLADFNADTIDPIERASTTARIQTAGNKAVTACLERARTSLSEVKNKIGDEVTETIARYVAVGVDSEGYEAAFAAEKAVRSKIDKSAEIPEARATLSGISETLGSIARLKITAEQQIVLQGLRTESKILLAALK